jgi:hypothetical protein
MAEAYFDVNPTDAEIKAARYALWEMGCLEWKLDISQLDIYKFFHDRKDKVIVVNASRRLGKTYALVIMAFEQCLQQERSVVKFIQLNNRTFLLKTLLKCHND